MYRFENSSWTDTSVGVPTADHRGLSTAKLVMARFVKGAAIVNTCYDVLGVPIHADAATIKTAFRQAAKACHPDHHRGNSNSDRFKRIAAAYAVLRDPMRRARYDRQLHDYMRRRRKRMIVDCAIFSLVGLVVTSFLVFETFGTARETLLRSVGSVLVPKAEEVRPNLQEVLPVSASAISRLKEVVPVPASEVSEFEELVPVEVSEVSKSGTPPPVSVAAAKPSPKIQSNRAEVAERSALRVVATSPPEEIGQVPGTPSSVDRPVGDMPTRMSRTGTDQRRALRADGNDPLAGSARRRSALNVRMEKPPRITSDMPSRLSYNRDDLEPSQVVDRRNSKHGFCLLEWRFYSPKVLWHIGECGDAAGR